MRTKFKKDLAGRPKDGSEDDCVVRAFAVHQGWSYGHAEGVVETMSCGYFGKGLTLDRFCQLAEALGMLEVKFPSDIPAVIVAERLGDCILWLPSDPPHVVGVVGGEFRDAWDSRYIPDQDHVLMPARGAWISPLPIQRRKR